MLKFCPCTFQSTYLPMDIISMSVSKLITRAATADATPDSTVATTGVPVNGNI